MIELQSRTVLRLTRIVLTAEVVDLRLLCIHKCGSHLPFHVLPAELQTLQKVLCDFSLTNPRPGLEGEIPFYW